MDEVLSFLVEPERPRPLAGLINSSGKDRGGSTLIEDPLKSD